LRVSGKRPQRVADRADQRLFDATAAFGGNRLAPRKVARMEGFQKRDGHAKRAAPGEQPIVLTSPMFELQLSLDFADKATKPAGAAESRLFETGVRAVPAGFGTLSHSQQSSVCDSCEAVRTTFVFAAFDPYLEFPASSGIARLELNYLNGSVVPVNKLDPPVSISLPAFSGSGHATCAFFNTTVGLYSADGVIGPATRNALDTWANAK
jgi:hypothetical protein